MPRAMRYAYALAVLLTGATLGVVHLANADAPTVIHAPVATPILAADIAPVAPAEKPTSPQELPRLEDVDASTLRQIAERDPEALPRMAIKWYGRNVKGYTATFLKQERIDGKLKPTEEIEARYRETPNSVYMIWQKNADKVKRALMLVGAENFVDDEGRQLVRIEPAGAVVRLLVSDIYLPVRGKMSRDASRRTMDDFGFAATLRLWENYNKIAREAGVLDVRYGGEGEVGDRKTFVIVRRLPYTDGGEYPDALLVMHLDQENLMPLAVYSYSDKAGKELLGSYVFTDVKINPGLTDDAFKF